MLVSDMPRQHRGESHVRTRIGSRRRTQVAGSDLGGVDDSGGGRGDSLGPVAVMPLPAHLTPVPIASALATKISPFAIPRARHGGPQTVTRDRALAAATGRSRSAYRSG